MNQASRKIRSHLDQLLSEKQGLERKIHDTLKRDKDLKSEMHDIELDILSDSLKTNPLDNTSKLFHEVNTLHHDKHDLHEDTHQLKTLTSSLHGIDKKITTAQFWMKQAENGDPDKQQDALRHVFG